MQLALVVGQVVSTVRCDGLGKDRLLLVDFIDAQGQPSGYGMWPPTAWVRAMVNGCWWSAAARRARPMVATCPLT
jgi:hypothetical protein